MKLKKFKAKGVFGYLDFDIQFLDEITFLTGINGSGKTTALRLIMALTTPSIRELDEVIHECAEVHIQTDANIFSISSECKKESITIKVSDVSEELTFARIDIRQYEDRPNSQERIEEHYSIVEEKLSNHAVIQFLTGLDTPTFLGLERRQQLGELERRIVFDPRTGRTMTRQRRAPFRGTLGASLADIQLLIQDLFRKIRIRQDQLNEQLKEEILLSAFQYEPFSGKLSTPELEIPKWQQQKQIKEKHREVEAALERLGLKHNRYDRIINEFFEKLGHIAGTRTDKESPQFLEWIINKPQIDRIDNVFRIVDEYNEKVSRLMEPIERFLSLVNRFLMDSNKELDIDSVGYLVVKIRGQSPRSLEALSSGERQVLVMLGHLAVNEESKNAGVFIVDEPELSLHLKWQEIFVDSIIEASPSTQFILATHAPSIILDRDDKFVSLGG